MKKTRSWDLIHTASKKIQQERLIYRQARQAMLNLGASDDIISSYKDLSTDDLKVSTAVQESNARGQRNQELSWIWRTGGVCHDGDDTYLTECKSSYFSVICCPVLSLAVVFRVNWIRARCRRDRWQEE